MTTTTSQKSTTMTSERQTMLSRVHKAIRDGKAFLDTFVGKRKVVSYNDETGNAVTNNSGDFYNRQTFMVCLDHISIED